jgi:hypothetical protein
MADLTPLFRGYAYANNNPYKFIDPDGRNPLAAAIYVGGGTILTIGAFKYATDPKARAAINRVFSSSSNSGGGSKQTPAVGQGPSANDGDAKKHGGDRHNQLLDDRVKELLKDPDVTNVRKNQTQVDVDGNKLDTNRPGIQFDKNNKHHVVEYDNDKKASDAHGERIRGNDPNVEVELIIIEVAK